MKLDFGEGMRRALYPLLVMGGDLVAFYLALWTAYIFRVDFLSRWVPLPFSQIFEDFLSRIWIPLVMVTVFAYEGLYTKREPFWEETRTVIRGLFLSFLVIFSIVSLGKLSDEVSRAVVVGAGGLSLGLVPLIRFRWKPLLHMMGIGIKKTVLIGDNSVGRLAHLGLFRDHYMGIRIVGSVSFAADTKPSLSPKPETETNETTSELPQRPFLPLPCLGGIEDLGDIVRTEGIRGAVVAVPHLRREDLSTLIERVQRSVLTVYVVPNVSQVSLLNSELLYLFYEEIFLLGIHNNLKSRFNRGIKTLSDYIGAFLIVIPLAPLLAGITFFVAATSSGPVFFTQRRVGKNGKIFSIYKFRTMYEGAEDHLSDLLAKNPELWDEYRRNRKLVNDPRITSVGKLLRMTSLDELPQLLNVLRGEMSLVGPRPAMEEEMEEHYRDLKLDYCLVKPGITGLWQVSGRSNNDFAMRVRLDLWYVRNWSLWLDLVILVRTMGVVLKRRGAV